MIIHNMRFLLLNDLLYYQFISTWSVDRVVVDLTTQQNENSGNYGEDRQDQKQATYSRDKRNQAPGNKTDGQQEHTDILCESPHGSNLFFT